MVLCKIGLVCVVCVLKKRNTGFGPKIKEKKKKKNFLSHYSEVAQ
jgi:hypothetical protein